MRYYAIREKFTGLFMPVPKDGERRSALLPTNTRPPRLWTSERHAKSFLTTWCKGEVRARNYQTMDGEWDYSLDIIPGTERRRSNYDIVPMELTVAG